MRVPDCSPPIPAVASSGLEFRQLTATPEGTQLCGSFGAMFVASTQQDGQHCYIIKVAKSFTPEANDEIDRELEALSQLSKLEGASKHCVLPCEIIAEEHESISAKFPFRSHIVFEYTTGQDALSWLQGQLDQDSDRLQDESHCQTVGSIVYQTHAAIEFLHDSDWVHGDVKPENVLICFIDGLVNAKLIDFGTAERKSNRVSLTLRGTHANFTLDMLLRHFMLGRIVQGSTEWASVLRAGFTSDCDYFALLLMAYRLSCARDLPLIQPPLSLHNSGALAIVNAFADNLDIIENIIEKFFKIKREQQGASSNNWMRCVLLQMREEVCIARRAIADQSAQECAQTGAPPRCREKRPSPSCSAAAAAGSSASGAHKRPKRPTLVVLSRQTTSPTTVIGI